MYMYIYIYTYLVSIEMVSWFDTDIGYVWYILSTYWALWGHTEHQAKAATLLPSLWSSQNHCEHVAICKMSPSACKNASSANVKGIHRSTSIRFQPFSGNLPSAIQQSASREMASTPTNPNRIPQIRMLSWRLHDFATKRWIAAVCQGASRPCYSQWQ